MQKISIGPYDAGQRLDKFLLKYFREADKSFLYKMLRKKNITLNGKKAEGSEKLQEQDELCFFFSDETFAKFRKEAASQSTQAALAAPERIGLAGDASLVKVIYEDSQILLVNKPAGMLSQKSADADISLCEHIGAYLENQEGMRSTGFKAGVSNRLDRNTSGLVMAGKTLPGQQLLSAMLKERELKKFYACIVKGRPRKEFHSRVYWSKNEESNVVTINAEAREGSEGVEIEAVPVKYLGDGFSMLRVRLITGKTHQIRAQLAWLGYPVLGDKKYGDSRVNNEFIKKYAYPLRHQLLHAFEVVFPDKLPAGILSLSAEAQKEAALLCGRRFQAPLPINFRKCLNFLGDE